MITIALLRDNLRGAFFVLKNISGGYLMKMDCESIAFSNQTRYNEEKIGGTIYGKNSKCICTCRA